MSHMVETMAYAGETPWHGLGFKVSDKLSPAQMLKAAKLDWEVEKRKLLYLNGEKTIEVPGKYSLTRKSDGSHLSIVGSTYKPVQNAEAMDFFKRFTDAGKMTMETAGSLWHGRYMWALARIKADFDVGKSDPVQSYLLLCSPHVHGKAMLIQTTAIRVVCWNTLTFAIGANLRGNGSGFRIPHSQDFGVMKEVAAKALGLVTQDMEQFRDAAKHLSKKKVSEEKAEEYFCEVLHYDPKKKTKGKVEKEAEREPQMLPKFRRALNNAPGAALGTAKGTMWGALNAITYVIDHETGRERHTALRNAWLGHTAAIKRRALHVALERAK